MNPHGEIYIEGLEGIMAMFAAMPDMAQRAAQSAAKSEAFRLLKIMKEGIRTGKGHASSPWRQLNPHTGVLSQARTKDGQKRIVKNWRSAWKGSKGSRRRTREYWEYRISSRTMPLQKFRGGLRYVWDDATEAVSTGFVRNSQSFNLMISTQASGFDVPVTDRMRRFLFALGFPLKKTTTKLRIPPRPLVGPVFDAEKNEIAQNMETKFYKNIDRYLSEKSR